VFGGVLLPCLALEYVEIIDLRSGKMSRYVAFGTVYCR